MLLKDMNIAILFHIFGKGKDAAVAYGSYDLKFKNNTGFDIKISTSATTNNVSVKLYKINF